MYIVSGINADANKKCCIALNCIPSRSRSVTDTRVDSHQWGIAIHEPPKQAP